MGPAYSAQFWGLDSAIIVSLPPTLFLSYKNSEIILRIMKHGFSEVFQILLCPSQKIPLILMIPTVSSLFSYLLWGMRNGSCYFLCLHAFSQKKFEIHMDHKNLSYFWEAHKLNCHQAWWSLYLSRFDFVLTHKPGRQMGRPDTLLRQVDHPRGVDDNTV